MPESLIGNRDRLSYIRGRKRNIATDYKVAGQELCNIVNEIENSYPDSSNIIMGDFNKCGVGKFLHGYHQVINCATRGENKLDLCFINLKSAYKCKQLPQLGESDHNTIFLTPTYRRKLKSSKPVTCSVPQWSEDSTATLQGCFDCTDWSILHDEDRPLEENLDVISSYINFCVDMVIPKKSFIQYPNNKP
jgi:hypothetical protein